MGVKDRRPLNKVVMMVDQKSDSIFELLFKDYHREEIDVSKIKVEWPDGRPKYPLIPRPK